MRVSKRRRPGSGGDVGGGIDGDGGGFQNKGGSEEDQQKSSSDAFVFGSRKGQDLNSSKSVMGEETVNRRPVHLSYKEKLLTLSGAGYLMNHDEEEDIVNGWKTLFARKNAVDNDVGGKDGSSEVGMNDEEGSNGKYPELVVTADQYKAWCKPWMNSLIIKLLGSHIPKQMLIDRVKRM